MKNLSELATMRHSASHLMAAAIMELFPKTLLGIGPSIEEGFYYDLELKKPLLESDLVKIERKMAEIQKKNLKIEKSLIKIDEALKIFADSGQKYKLELIKELKEKGEKQVSFYTLGDFIDLCVGPHVQSTKQIGPFKLLSIAGAYWRGSEKNKMLTRIYGTCFPSEKELKDFLYRKEEAKKRDHRLIGKQQDLFSFHSEAPGDIFWHDKGYRIFRELLAYWRQIHNREGYLEVRTPEILTKETWDRSGHTKFFLDKIYKVITPDSQKWNMAVKPMNCDGGILIYKSKLRSYRQFPLKMGEIGVVHRFESSGELLGILRPREFTQDDAHIYCTPQQIKEELKKVMDLCFEVYKTFGLELDHLELSTRPEKFIGSRQIWDRAEDIMRQVLKEKDVPCQINEGEGAFYGPKFDFHLKDVIGRTWQCSTIQLDFAQPENFDLEYVTAEGKKERPVMIHRVLFGSVERFLGILIEHFAGVFPVWLAPVQVILIPITDKQEEYAKKIIAKIREAGIRVELDQESGTMAAKIREAELQKIPYMIILGSREAEANTISVRARGEKDLGTMKLEELLGKIKEEIEKRA